MTNKMDENYLKQSAQKLDQQELEYRERRYPTSEVYKGLGLTRDALRYYEELGILSPAKNEENSYREYSMDDILSLLAIDFYKKRGITPKEIKMAKEVSSQESYIRLFADKKAEIEETIKEQKNTLRKIKETMSFLEKVETEMDILQIKEFPLYEIEEEFSSLNNFKEYQKTILSHIDITEEDIFTSFTRTLLFDEHGYTGAKSYLVKPAKRKRAAKQYLEQGECLYTILSDSDTMDNNIMENMFIKCTSWEREHNRKFKGVVYLQPKCISWIRSGMTNYMECWIPLKPLE